MSGPVVLTGGTGLIGGRILPTLAEWGEVRLLTRSPERAPPTSRARVLGWDGLHFPAKALDGVRAVVHLAGEPVFGGLATKKRLARLYSSRVDSTRHLIERIAERPPGERPDIVVCASAVGFYGDRGEEALRESAEAGTGFLAELCIAWEEAADRARSLGLRVVRLRFGIVLARGAGALGLMAPIFKTGLGGRLGSGRQWFPWVHVDDAAGLVLRAVEDPELDGALNVVAPAPVRNEELTRVLATQVRRPAFLAVPPFALRAALGPLASELLGSKRVVPERASSLGFAWRHEQLEGALEAELGSPPVAS